MGFNLSTWKQDAAERLRRIGAWLDRHRKQDVPYLVYGSLCGLSLWPLVEAAQSAQLMPVIMALGGVAGGVGGNLIAEQLQRWTERADEVDEDAVVDWVMQHAADQDVRDALDAILEKLDSITQARAALSETQQQSFDEALHEELSRLGNLNRFTAQLKGSGAIAQGQGAKAAGERAVVADGIHGSVLTGEGSRVVQAETYVEKLEVHPDPSVSAASKVRQRYLTRLMQRMNVLPLAALGGDEETSEDVGLDQVYVNLDTQTRVALSEEEKEKHERGVVRPGDDRPLSVLEAATQTKRLVLLGDAGSGKSTFVRQLCVWLASAYLGKRDPIDGWEAGLLPLLMTLRDLAPRLARLELDALSDDERDRVLVGAVWEQWQADLRNFRADDFAEELEQTLTDGKVVLIFDGLDEVAQRSRRRVRQAVRAVLRDYPKVQHVLVSCRIRSYSGDAVLPGYTTYTLAPFDDEKIGDFISGWYQVQARLLARMSNNEAEEKTADLQQAALSSDLRELASNPMLLTTMAIIHQREVGLPNERVRLYLLAVQVLITRWQKRKGMALSEQLSAVLTKDLTLRSILERLAYEAHRLQSKQGQEENLSRKNTLALLEQPQYLGDAGLASEFLDYVDQRAGLLVGHGGDEHDHKPQTYSFLHRTFQEYLAGCYMIAGRGIAREFWKRAAEGDYWYLAAQLGAEELLHNRINTAALLDLAYDLCPEQVPQKQVDWRAALWSGQIATRLGLDTVREDDKAGGGEVYLGRLLPRLVQIVSGNDLGALERVEAGRVLALLGDTRREVMDVQAMQFCHVPAAPFWMGSEEDDDEKLHLNEHLNYDYWIARHPVTVAQYAAFVAAGGYQEPRYWSEAQAAGVWQDGQVKGQYDVAPRAAAYDSGEPYNLSNHPLMGVMWYEALAFTRWLTEHLHEAKLLAADWHVRLPSEAEWEKAARGGLKLPAAPLIDSLKMTSQTTRELVDNPAPRRVYPWGDAPDANRANYNDSGVGTTSALGCFTAGASPYGVLDMSGNVWEWTQSLRGDYPYDPEDGREKLEGEDSRVLRGGSFINNQRYVRCAVRITYAPDYRYGNYGFRVVASPFSF